jgi:hypothetical protein
MSGGSNGFSARRRAISIREPFWANCRLRESRFSRSLLRVAKAGHPGLRPIVASQPTRYMRAIGHSNESIARSIAQPFWNFVVEVRQPETLPGRGIFLTPKT